MKSLALSLLFVICTNFTFSQTTSLLDRPNIHVEGFAFEEVVPDEIFIKVTIFDDKDKSVETKQSELIKGLSDLGIESKKITLMNEGANFGRLTWNRKEVVKSLELSVMAASADEVIKIFKKLDQLEVDDAYIYKLDYSKREEIEKMVRIEAISNAKSHATDLLGAIGSKVGAPLKVSKGSRQVYNNEENISRRNYKMGETVSFYKTSDFAYFDGSFQKIKIDYAVDCWFTIE
jgi:hypothetical protein